MKKGYSVENYYIERSDNCIIVDNYNERNHILNLPIEKRMIKEYKDRNTIGVWKRKVKNLTSKN